MSGDLAARFFQLHQHLALAVVGALELQQADHLARQRTQHVLGLLGQMARPVVQHAERAQGITIGRDQRRPGIEAERIFLGHDAEVRKTRILCQVGHDENAGLPHGVAAHGLVQRGFPQREPH